MNKRRCDGRVVEHGLWRTLGKREVREGSRVRIPPLPCVEGWQSLVDCTGLESRWSFTRPVGSNPTPSCGRVAELAYGAVLLRQKSERARGFESRLFL